MKKALIITYYWPPAGGPGVQRILNIVEHLPDLGWEPIILTVEDPSAPAKDDSLLKRIPQNCKVYKTKTSEPFNAYKKLTGKSSDAALPKNVSLDGNSSLKEKLSRWVRANLFIPDARKGWKGFMVKEGAKIIEKEKPDVIFSTSPPHSLQLGAMKLAKKSGVPWVCDLRDPWTEAYWETKMPKTALSRKLNKRFEQKALNKAEHITTIGRGVSDLLASKTKTKIDIIYNGYRELNVDPIETDKFEILHLGNLSSMQNCDTLYKALEVMGPAEQMDVKLSFIGSVSEEHKLKIAMLENIDIEYLDFLPYDEMAERARAASMLLLPKLDSSYSKGLISAKLFDYLALRRPVIAISDLGSDISEIINITGSGKTFLPDEHREMLHYISDHLNLWHKNGQTILEDSAGLGMFSIKHNVCKLIKIFEIAQKNN